MTFVQIIALAIKASMFLIVFAIGLNATMKDFNYVLRHPALLVRSLLSMNVIMLVFAVAVVTATWATISMTISICSAASLHFPEHARPTGPIHSG